MLFGLLKRKHNPAYPITFRYRSNTYEAKIILQGVTVKTLPLGNSDEEMVTEEQFTSSNRYCVVETSKKAKYLLSNEGLAFDLNDYVVVNNSESCIAYRKDAYDKLKVE